MSKSLEALKRIKKVYELFVESKNNEELNYAERQDFETIEKELEALEIIKKKPQFEIAYIQLRKIKTYDEYCEMVADWELGYGDMALTEEEYDLLKEIGL